jgi:hypothetical protein
MTEQAIELPELPEPAEREYTTWAMDAVFKERWSADQMREYARQAVLADRARIESSEVVQFLCGASELDGSWYGDGAPEGKPKYWWRSVLRAAIRGS